MPLIRRSIARSAGSRSLSGTFAAGAVTETFGLEAWRCDRAWALCAVPNAMSAIVKTVRVIVSWWAQAFCALLAAMDQNLVAHLRPLRRRLSLLDRDMHEQGFAVYVRWDGTITSR